MAHALRDFGGKGEGPFYFYSLNNFIVIVVLEFPVAGQSSTYWILLLCIVGPFVSETLSFGL